ncbi:MAG TPA: Eco57I restriction-modification methylase domain-containing protein, partial [Spirochaetota bacterium]|nr:Eco57I restriction-modification methylase domain-containing protein [Spirochaetota bacterium]
DNLRIASHLSLNKGILELFQKYINPFVLCELDYKIQNINSLANDLIVAPIERASNAMKKFSRLSDSEVVTPGIVTDKLINAIPDDAINNKTFLIDIAAKQGEFVYSVYKKYGRDVANKFYSIPTSNIAYEFTRKVYTLLELDLSHIEQNYTSYDLIKENDLIENETIKINNTSMKFDVIVGNPPYQQKDEGTNKNSASPIYNKFMDAAKSLSPNYISMIMPTKWYAGGKGLDSFRDEMLNDIHISELHDFLEPELIFKNINLRGGICYLLWDKSYDNSKDLTKMCTYKDNLIPTCFCRSLKTEGSYILIRHNVAVEMLNKICSHFDFDSFKNYISSRKPFGIEGNITNNEQIFITPRKNKKNLITCYARGRKICYVDKSLVTENEYLIDKVKVFAPYTNNIGTELNDDNLNVFIGDVGTICTETYIVFGIGLSLDIDSANNMCKYFKSKFARFTHSLAKASHHGTSKTYIFVPNQNFTNYSDIDWSKSIQEIDKQLYSKYNLTNEEIEFIESMIKPMIE